MDFGITARIYLIFITPNANIELKIAIRLSYRNKKPDQYHLYFNEDHQNWIQGRILLAKS